MEVFNKPPLTYEKQVELLLSRGLIVTDRKRAERHLANISYYRLSAYMLPYKKKEDGIIIDAFKEGTTWDDIYDLYVSDRDITVAIDTVLTPALIEEGFMREIISKVQTMRKEAGFEVTDHIRITMQGSEKVTAVAEARKAEIAGATLAESLTIGTPAGYTKEWDLNGEKATLGVEMPLTPLLCCKTVL